MNINVDSFHLSEYTDPPEYTEGDFIALPRSTSWLESLDFIFIFRFCFLLVFDICFSLLSSPLYRVVEQDFAIARI